MFFDLHRGHLLTGVVFLNKKGVIGGVSFCGSIRPVASSSWLPAVARDCADLAPVERVFFVDIPFVLVEVMNMYNPKNSPFSRKWMVGRCSFPIISFLSFGLFLVSGGVFLLSMGKFNRHFFSPRLWNSKSKILRLQINLE